MINGCIWTRTRNAEATDLQSAAMPIPLIHPDKTDNRYAKVGFFLLVADRYVQDIANLPPVRRLI